MFRFILLAALTVGSTGLEAQKAKPEMEVHIDARNVQRGLPQQFRFTLRNMSDHDIHLPEPMLGCNSPDGAVLLVTRIVAQKPAAHPVGDGCTAIGADQAEGVLARARSWVVLRSGGYLERAVDAKKMSLEDQGAGSYEMSAEYLPPTFSVADQRMLAKVGISYPHTRLVSEKVSFRKDR